MSRDDRRSDPQVVELAHRFTFEAAHYLPRVPEGHKCRRLHGHSFAATIVVRGPIDPEMGWLVDYAEIKGAVAPLREMLDHHLLNEVEGLENPTSEVIAVWLWDRLLPSLPILAEVRVEETCNNGCAYRGGSI
ncbi:MAG: 6-carboxytetrahydropterin synthase QueD [Planctomycetota bacterium]|jgi:6-pyruvoyltetrahydropterin/6-carboxytetrahydropterin synthase